MAVPAVIFFYIITANAHVDLTTDPLTPVTNSLTPMPNYPNYLAYSQDVFTVW